MDIEHVIVPDQTRGAIFDTHFLRQNSLKVVIQEIYTRRYSGSAGVWTLDMALATTSRWQPDWQGLPRRLVKHGLSYLLVLVAAYGFFKFSHEYLVQSVQVDGSSMLPTLPNAQCYLLNRFVYLLREPKLKEIVVLRDPETGTYAVKRIVATPGDSVYVKGGQLFVNGKLVPEPYLELGTKTYASQHYRAQMWICGLNQYFVMGDNRKDSADSRVYGAVPRRNILGMVTP